MASVLQGFLEQREASVARRRHRCSQDRHLKGQHLLGLCPESAGVQRTTPLHDAVVRTSCWNSLRTDRTSPEASGSRGPVLSHYSHICYPPVTTLTVKLFNCLAPGGTDLVTCVESVLILGKCKYNNCQSMHWIVVKPLNGFCSSTSTCR